MKRRPARLARRAAQASRSRATSPSPRRARASRSRRRSTGSAALPIMLRPDELQLGRGEPIADTARVLSSYCAAIVIRTFAQADVEALAAAATVPVINALTDDHHPCQALADLLTLREHFGQLEGVARRLHRRRQQRRALADGGRRARRHGHPRSPARPATSPTPRSSTAQRSARANGGRVRVVHDPREAVAGAHAVYTDVWVSMGDEAEQRAPARRRSRATRSTPALMAQAAAGRRVPALPARPPRRGGRRRGDRRPAVARVRSRPPTGCRPSRPCSTRSSTGEWEGSSMRVVDRPRRQRAAAPRRARRRRRAAPQRRDRRRGASPSSPREHEVIVTHGNGPQVGLLALQGEAYAAVAPYPLDVLGAESEGMIGYLLDQELVNALGGPAGRDAAHPGDRRRATTRRSRARPSRSARSTTARPPSGSPPSAAGRSRPTARTGAASSPSPEPRSIVELRDAPAARRRRRARRLRRRRRVGGRGSSRAAPTLSALRRRRRRVIHPTDPVLPGSRASPGFQPPRRRHEYPTREDAITDCCTPFGRAGRCLGRAGGACDGDAQVDATTRIAGKSSNCSRRGTRVGGERNPRVTPTRAAWRSSSRMALTSMHSRSAARAPSPARAAADRSGATPRPAGPPRARPPTQPAPRPPPGRRATRR